MKLTFPSEKITFKNRSLIRVKKRFLDYKNDTSTSQIFIRTFIIVFCCISSYIFFLYKIQKGCASFVALVREELDDSLKDAFKRKNNI